MAQSQTGTADFASTFSTMVAFTLSTGADAAVVNLREGSVGGTIKYIIKNATAQTTVHCPFDEGVTSASGPWFVDLVSGTTPQMTITGS